MAMLIVLLMAVLAGIVFVAVAFGRSPLDVEAEAPIDLAALEAVDRLLEASVGLHQRMEPAPDPFDERGNGL